MNHKSFLQACAGAGVILTLAFIIAPLVPFPDNGSNRDVEAFIVRWQSASYNPTTRPQAKNHYDLTAVDTLGSVTGLQRDTTGVFEIQPYMSADVILKDAAGDSAAQTMLLYGANDNQFRKNIPAWSDFTLIDSIQVSTESTTQWLITDSPVPIKKYGFIINRGNAANKKTAAVTCKITFGGRQMR